MKKILLTILIIVTIAAMGYFAYTNIYKDKFIEDDITTNNYPEIKTENKDVLIQDDDQVVVVKKPEGSGREVVGIIVPNTNITTTYMCEDKVRIEKEQESPSLPPRISYIRESDNVEVAYYGDFGAYIRPEYFSIDRKQIEQGYGFNEINFCKYLKN